MTDNGPMLRALHSKLKQFSDEELGAVLALVTAEYINRYPEDTKYKMGRIVNFVKKEVGKLNES